MGLRSEYARKYIDCLMRREPQLVAVLRRVGFPQQVAVDAAQEAMFVAYGVIVAETVERLADRWRWLIGVAVNKGRDISRGRWHRCSKLNPDALAVDPFGEQDESPAVLGPVGLAFDSLPPNLRELVDYVYLGGHTYAEAAEKFRLGLGVVSARLRRAKRRLRSALSASPEFGARAAATRG
jgi:RNA polymerase sigma-70 factor (ECF subfamily)